MRGEVTGLHREPRRWPEVIGVEDRQQLAGGGGDGCIPRSRRARIGLVHRAQLRMRGQDLGRAIRRAVVADDDLEGRVVLGEDARDRLLEERLRLKCGHDHAYERLLRHGLP